MPQAQLETGTNACPKVKIKMPGQVRAMLTARDARSGGPRLACRVLDMPENDRPRERMEAHGAEALADRELLALLLNSGAPGISALDLADALLDHGLRDLGLSSQGELERRVGIGPAKASRILAALELGARSARDRRRPKVILRTAEALGRHLIPRYAARAVEVFGVLLLDVRQRLLRELVISVGCLTASLVHPREVFKEAVVSRAAGVVLFHNHPSGDPEPSGEDVALTRRLDSAGRLLGIEVCDHIVVGAGRYVSLRRRGLF